MVSPPSIRSAMRVPAIADQVTPAEFMALATSKSWIPSIRPISGRPSGVKDSGPLMKRWTGAFARAGNSAVACSK